MWNGCVYIILKTQSQNIEEDERFREIRSATIWGGVTVRLLGGYFCFDFLDFWFFCRGVVWVGSGGLRVAVVSGGGEAKWW